MAFDFDVSDLGDILGDTLKEGLKTAVQVAGKVAEDRLTPAKDKPVERQIATTATTQAPANDPIKKDLGGTAAAGGVDPTTILLVGAAAIAVIAAAFGLKKLLA